MARKGKRSRLFRRKPDMLLIDERVSTIVLPVLPSDHVFVDDEEDELLYAEEVENVAMESQPAAPLRVFLGANVDADADATDPLVSDAWDLSSLVDDDDDFESAPVSPPPLKPRIGGLATLSTASLPVEEGESVVGSTPRQSADTLVAETKRRPALATLSAVSMPVEEAVESDWDLPQATAESSVQLPDFKPSSSGVATLRNASLAVETPADVSLNQIDPETPLKELERPESSYFNNDFSAPQAKVRIAPISPHASQMDDFDYDEDDYSESEIDDSDDFYASPKPIAPSVKDVVNEPFIRPQDTDVIDRKSNLAMAILTVVFFVVVLAFAIHIIGNR